MKFGKSRTMDRLRSTLGGLTRFKSAGSASDTGLSRSDPIVVEHQQETQVALQELRNLVLEAISLETLQRSDPAAYAEIETLSGDSINFASMDTGDLVDSTIESQRASDSLPGLMDSMSGRSLTALVHQA